MKGRSLQTRLLAGVLGLVMVVWLGAAVATWFDARHELDELLDSHLAQAASLLVAQQIAPDDDDDAAMDTPTAYRYAPHVAFQVFHAGALVVRSANAPAAPMAPLVAGFSTVRMPQGHEWRVFASFHRARDVYVLVGEETAARGEILRAILRSLLLPLAFALPLLALGGWWAVRQGLQPLRQLSQVLGLRQPQALEAVHIADLPPEMRPMVQALNGLLERIARMRESERRFTADAAHELRTPMAAIRAQAQVALGAGADADQRQHALRATLEGCDRATRLVEQLLTLARLEATGTTPSDTLDLCAVARSTAADLAPAALQRQQTLELDADTACSVPGDAVLAGVLVRNLVDNALRYSPPGARIQIRVAQEGGQTLLQVEDSGPGMAEADMAHLGERFYRPLGQEPPGSGLGWSIVQRVAEVLGAQVQVGRSARLGGLAVAVRWSPGRV
ncbi:sensor protein QseC [Comamonadaceae bacterium OS-1]|nr:sensor protein QseC [Comamonadaceae bacterium OS-1]